MKQSIPNGTLVMFDLKDIRVEEFPEEQREDVELADGAEGCVLCLTMATELGDQDYEYYDVEFDTPDGVIKLEGVSGYHLVL